MAGKFQIYQDKQGQYRFRLLAANGQVVATGQGYKAKKSCVAGIESVKKNAPTATVEEVES